MESTDSKNDTITLHPTEGFVIKSRIESATDLGKYSLGTKVFINVCHDQAVPRPSIDFDPAVVFPLIISNEWEIPMIVSTEKSSADKKGLPSFVYDCCINTTCFQWCQINGELRSILIEWCLESIELMYELSLSREYSTPKMLQKGKLSETEVLASEIDGSGLKKKLQDLHNNETLGLIEEINWQKEQDEEESNLPDLMNIQNAASEQNPQQEVKPLIEEVEDINVARNKKKQSRDHTAKPIQPAQSSTAQKIDYTVTMSKVPSPYKLLIKVEVRNVADSKSFDVNFCSNSKALRITNLDKLLYFNNSKDETRKNTLEIPIPFNYSGDGGDLQCFYVIPDKTFYFYL
ncbi:Piso0_005756 [Millerozyma farinosa CBS 7064]|uniref:Piso0_005756 protein n=1 Tax=Pichia sorbitophila (strain ATCC MYA-4447 / BCRC 22081 / CBS 7064 / NBRC 10061 / NRRL Y-12695) TaxID=559304 RepID=G8Y2U5_PICSO|nr:Piso0_005756 [Millerozyma farinosa CBS 7064]